MERRGGSSHIATLGRSIVSGGSVCARPWSWTESGVLCARAGGAWRRPVAGAEGEGRQDSQDLGSNSEGGGSLWHFRNPGEGKRKLHGSWGALGNGGSWYSLGLNAHTFIFPWLKPRVDAG